MEATELVLVCLGAAGFDAISDPDIQGQIWLKVAFNAAFNVLATLTRVARGGLDNPSGRWIVQSMVAEFADVARAQGRLFHPEAIYVRIEGAFVDQAGHLLSMLQDLLAGRRTEIDPINRAIVRMADAARVPAPVNRTLAELVCLSEA